MWIKICGVTTAEDARAAADLGVDAVGLNFWEGSPRRVDVRRATEIARALRGAVQLVGLFVDASDAEIDRVRKEVSLDDDPPNVVRWEGRDGVGYLVMGRLVLHVASDSHRVLVSGEITLASMITASKADHEHTVLPRRSRLLLIKSIAERAIADLRKRPDQLDVVIAHLMTSWS